MDEWVEVMEKMLPLSLIATKGGIESLISLCSTLIEEQKQKAKTSKHTFWQNWREKSLQISTPPPQPLSPEQMLQDKQVTCTRVSEVKSMLEELLNSTIFSQGEVRAIRYMSTTVENLRKALMLQHQENRSLENKYRCLKIKMTKELSSQRLHFQKSIQVLETKRNALMKQVESLGGKYHDLLLVRHTLELQLKKAQSARVQTKELDKSLVDSPGSSEKEPLPKEKTIKEATQQEPKEEEEQQLILPLSPRPVVTAWDSGDRPSVSQSHSIGNTHLRIADVYSRKDTQTLEPVLLSTADQKLPMKWEKPEAKMESVGHKHEDQDLLQEVTQEEEGMRIQLILKQQLSPESSMEVAVQSQLEEFSRERQRQQWLEEEEMWQQKQKKWALLEQEHHEKLRQWEMEEVAREQQRLVQLEKEQGSPRKELEQPQEDPEKMLFTTTSQWRDLREESLPPPPLTRSQSAQQVRRPHLPRSPDTSQLTRRNKRTLSSAKCTQKPRTYQIPKRPQKSASFPTTGTLISKVPQSPLIISQVTLKGRIYHMDTKTLRKNLQLLSEESSAGLPYYLRCKVLELTSTALELSTVRLQYLCCKYICYRRFQSLRQEIMNHIQVTQETDTLYKAQHLRIVLEKVAQLQNLQLQAWTDRQKALEELRQECLSSMAAMFPKLKLECNIHLHSPVVTSQKSRKSKPFPSLPHGGHSSSSSCRRSQEHFKPKPQDCVSVQMPCPQPLPSKQETQMKGIWKTDVASSSHPIAKKIPTSLTWDQLGGHPDVPRLLALDIHSFYNKSLMSLKTCASATQGKEDQEPSDESAELVQQKPSESFPGT
ncbi:protein FAM186B isoform X2 [Erinaceus europaeus]|nr:protein FAM186B isoform X2 [Erinaceus europaeus]